MDARAVSDALGDWMTAESEGRVPDRLALAFAHAIHAGLLPAGTRLPPERELALALAVSRPTLRSALADLRRRGLVGALQGSGTWVCGRDGPRGPSFAEAVSTTTVVNLAIATPWDARALTACGVHLSAREILGVRPTDGYGPGTAELHELLAHRFSAQQVPTRPAQVVLARGAQHGLHATLQLLTGPGDRVLVEREAYPGTFDILDALGLIPIPADVHDPDAVERVLSRRSVSVALVQPVVNNPTGRCLRDDQLDALAGIFNRRRLPVVENNVLADLRFDGQASAGLAIRCQTAPAITIGSLSKTIWGGLRVGWVRGPDGLAAELRRRIVGTELGMSAPSQLLAEQVLSSIDPVLARRRAELTQRATLLRNRLTTDIPQWTHEQPGGGLSLWVRLPVRDSTTFVDSARLYGVDIVPGRLAMAGRQLSSHIRLCFDRPPPIIHEGADRLAAAWRAHLDKRSRG